MTTELKSDVGGIVVDDTARHRFVLAFPGGEALATYRKLGRYLVVSHTEVPAAARGQGIASRLVTGMFELARTRGELIVPACSYVAQWVRNHPDYHDVVARHPGMPG
jgi:predicted GNAT family acetyltransferase